LFLARLYLRIIGWKVLPPPQPFADKMVLVAAPHTSNWDFVVTIAAARVSGLFIQWLGKASLFKPPFGKIMRKLGGIPVDRSAANGMVAAMAAEFDRHQKLCLVVPAEGTRSKTDYWKSGFYRIAEQAHVPVILGFVDASTKTCGFGPMIEVTGDMSADMDKFREFYADKTGIKPGRFGPIRLREESGEPSESAAKA
jgi:1-acyl-sn-glycerol-3-phosphate acyltransferase